MRCGGAVTRFIGECRRDRLVAVHQRAHVRCRNAHAPAPGRIQHCGVVFPVQGHRDDIARLRARHLTGDDQRLTVLSNVHDVIARDDVEANLWHGGIHQNGGIRACRVTGFIGNRCRDRGVTVADACQIRRRHVECPAAVRLHLRGVLLAVERDRHRLAGFGRGGAAQGQILPRLSRVEHIVIADGVDADRRRSGIDAEFLRRRRRVAVHVGNGYLHAGVAVFQAAQIGCRNGVRPVAVGIHGRRPGFTRKGNGHGLTRFHIGGGAGKQQILTFFRRVEHVIVGHAADSDGDRREIDIHNGANSHRVAGGILCACLDIERTLRPLRHIRGRDRRLPGAVRQHGGEIVAAVNGYRDGAARDQIGAGAGHNQVLTVFDDVNHVIARHGVNTQSRKLGVDGEVQRG